MESILSSQEDHLLSSLSYKIPPNSGASYVTERRAVTYFPMGSNIYNPTTGTRQIRFNLASDQFIDLSSLASSFDLNMGATGIGTPLVDGGTPFSPACVGSSQVQLLRM